MRHHTTSIVGPDIDGNEQAVWAKMFPYHTTPVKDAPPAQPSVGEKLGEVAWRASGNNEPFVWNQQDQRLQESYRNAALAVRREVLAEVFTREDRQAADVAYMECASPEVSRAIDAALSAALASRAKREGAAP
jgi:hypothetical protein